MHNTRCTYSYARKIFILLVAISHISVQAYWLYPSPPPPTAPVTPPAAPTPPVENPYTPKIPPCYVSGMAGTCPTDACDTIKRLMREANKISFGPKPSEKSEDKNLLLFEGPTGIGKTRLAEAIAKESDSHFFKINTPKLLNRYLGGTTEALMAEIDKAMAEGKALNKRVVILFDEIDKLANNETSAAHTEYDAAMAALWCYIDDNQYKPEVLFIFATNRLDRLPLPFKNRIGRKIVSMKNPDAQQRRELLDCFSKELAQKKLAEYCTDTCIQTVVEQTEHFSIRDIEDLCFSSRDYAARENTPITENHLLYALQAMKAKVALQHTPTEAELEKQRTLKRENEQDAIQQEILKLQQASYNIQRAAFNEESTERLLRQYS